MTGWTRPSSRWPATASSCPLVRRQAYRRGVSTPTAFALAVELRDGHRFSGDSVGAFVGLIPSEHSSGAFSLEESITKAGMNDANKPTPAGIAILGHATRPAEQSVLQYQPANIQPDRPSTTTSSPPRTDEAEAPAG